MPQRPKTVRVDAAEFSDWISINRMTTSFTVGLAVEFSDDGNLTVDVQQTFDDPYERTMCQFARVGTSLTVNKPDHGLVADDWAKIEGSPGGIWDAQYAVASVTDADNFVVTVANSGAAAGSGWVKTARVSPHPVLAGLTADAQSNYSAPPRACRLNCSAYTAGFAELTVIQGGK